MTLLVNSGVRLFGVVSPRGGREALAQLGYADQLGASRHCIGTACFAWSDFPSVSAVAGNGLLAVVDGRFYNSADLDLPKEASCAGQLIELYRRHGFEGALARINGDFAVALYDVPGGSVYVGRDRVGNRPLYYARTTDAFVFSSRASALLSMRGVSRAVNRRWAAVFAGSHYRYIDNHPDESPFEAVHQLPAATLLEFTNGTLRRSCYWALKEEIEFAADEAELAIQYRELLLDAVKCRLSHARLPAFTLSGGMDSSSIMACAVALTGRKQVAFSSVYTDRTYDESDEIKDFVREKAAQWHPVLIEDIDLFDTVAQMVRAHDEPVATATWLSHFLLCRQVRSSGYATLFGGLGGDELNAGEYEYFPFYFADLKRFGNTTTLERELAKWSLYHDHPIYRKTPVIGKQLLACVADPSTPGRVKVDRERLMRYSAAVSPDYFDLKTFEPALDHPFASWLKNRAYQDIFRETTPCCLRAEDRNCAAWAVDHMDPFLDHRVMEFMFRVPGSMKIRDGVTKHLLREAVVGIVPDKTRTRIKKTGWNAPAHIWFADADADQLSDLVRSRAFRERGLYDATQVLKLIDEHRRIVGNGEARENHMMFLWQLVNLELWFQEVADPLASSSAAITA